MFESCVPHPHLLFEVWGSEVLTIKCKSGDGCDARCEKKGIKDIFTPGTIAPIHQIPLHPHFSSTFRSTPNHFHSIQKSNNCSHCIYSITTPTPTSLPPTFAKMKFAATLLVTIFLGLTAAAPANNNAARELGDAILQKRVACNTSNQCSTGCCDVQSHICSTPENSTCQ